ncbi:MAG TPA: NAD(P)-dependent oxidoreductase [bacterium]|nr:NAD(P)-dependent oxidoreductase [bacterium]
MEKYLVTGACGFTGSHICDILSERGIPYRATDLASADKQWLPRNCEFVPSDLTDPASLKTVLKGITIVLHPAAIFDWSASEELLDAVNVQGMENLCSAAKEEGVKRLVSWSTSGVYGDQKFDRLPICEDYPVKPIDKYSISKHRQDKIALRFSQEEGLETTIIRPGIVYGPRSKYGAMQFFESFAMIPVVPIPVNFDVYKLGTVHVRDVAGAGIFVSTKPEAVGQIYAAVDSSDITIAGFWRHIAAAMNKPTIPIYLPPMLARTSGLIFADILDFISKNITHKKPVVEKDPIKFFPISLDVSNQKIRDLGYKFEYNDVRIGVIETIDWMRNEGMMDKTILQFLKENF